MANIQIEFTMRNMESKYWFSELSSDIATNTIMVEVYTRHDDEKIGEIELIYNYDKNNNYGADLSLDLIASSSSQVIPVDMGEDLGAGLFIQPFARFSLN